MRKIIMAALAVLGLSACATPESLQREAALNCQAVGIGEKDPQFATCTQAFRRAHLEDRLDETYHNALNATPDDRRIRHQWVY